ncbi:MAG: alkaline phosphatase family protein [Sphingobacteriales bacterium]|nr:MAG: alkaline phosphatase family protein [Sphingobacteriales bacterium]
MKNILLYLILAAFSIARAIAQPASVKDFSFITGSCAFLNRALEDQQGIKYNGDTSIFYTMAGTNADFMLWLGDNWYLDEIETRTIQGLKSKAASQRSSPLLRRIAEKMPEYAIWDDHDYGPNDAGYSFPLKKASREIFMDTWKANPGFGMNNEGVFTAFHQQDVLFVLLDSRWWRSSDKLWDYVPGKGRGGLMLPNPAKEMLGKSQMTWLKEMLLKDTSAFKIIVNGSQMLNPLAKGDCLVHFPSEYYELLAFLHDNKIEGVIFLTGDRHFSEIIGLKRQNDYPLYDITVSSLTADIDNPDGRERNNPYRVQGSLIRQHNFARITCSGPANNRQLRVSMRNSKGIEFYYWDVYANQLKAPR